MIAVPDYAEGIILATHDSIRAKKIRESLATNNDFIDLFWKNRVT